MYVIYTKMFHILKDLFLTRNHKYQRLHHEVVTITPVKDGYLFRQRRFNDLFEIIPYIILIVRLAITDFDTFLFLRIGGSPSSMSNPPNTHPPSSNLSSLKASLPPPLQNLAASLWQPYLPSLCCKIWSRNMELQSK